MPKITVYITSHNYAKYIEQAIRSVLNQTFQDFELLIFNDGSTDNTAEILKKYDTCDNIKIINQENQGLPKTCNNALKIAQGEYIMRLDADDFLDENALSVMSNTLNAHPEAGLVYSDYYEVDKEGKILNIIRRDKIGEEDKILDLPAHGACTMIRKKCICELGGYNDNTLCQDGYGLWIKFIKQFKPYNINLTLFYYRKHNDNLTSNTKKILTARKQLKQEFVNETHPKKQKILLIIPTRGEIGIYPKLPLKEIAGKPLIYYPISTAKRANVDKIVVISESEEVLKYCQELNVETIKRPEELAKPNSPIEPTINFVLEKVESEGFLPSQVVLLNVTSPLIRSEHINEAINTLLIYNADSVISVKENSKFHYKHGEFGLEPLFNKRVLRLEREILYEETGGLFVSKRESITKDDFLGIKKSHIILDEDEGIDIHSKFNFWLVEEILKR